MRYQITDGTLSLGGERVLSHIMNFSLLSMERVSHKGEMSHAK